MLDKSYHPYGMPIGNFYLYQDTEYCEIENTEKLKSL